MGVIYPDPDFNTTLGFFQHLNTVTGNWWATGLLTLIFVVSFVGFKPQANADSLTGAGFITFIAASLMAILEWISPEIVTIPLAITVLGWLFIR